MHARIVAGEIAAAADHIAALLDAIRGQVDGCAHRIARAFGAAHELELQPVVVIWIYVAQEHRVAVDHVDDGVDFAVIEQVSHRHAATCNDVCQASSLHRRDRLKLLALEVAKQKRPLLPGGSPGVLIRLRIDVAIGDQDVLPAIVVVIEKGVAESEERNGSLAETDVVAEIGEVGVAVVVVERVVGIAEGGVVNIELACVLIVADGEPHGSRLQAGLIERKSRRITVIFKRAVALVDVEIVGCGVVGHKQVQLAIVIDVGEHRAQPVIAGLVGHSGLHAYVGEGAVAVVVEEMIAFAGQAAGTAANLFAAEGAERVGRIAGTGGGQMLRVVMEVPGDKQIEAAVAIVIAPGGAGVPGRGIGQSHAGFLCNVGKCAVVIVVVEAVAAPVGHEDVGPAVIVVIGNGHAKAPAVVGDAGLLRNVGEGSIVIVVEEGGVRRRLFTGERVEGGPVHDVDVHPTIVVVVNEADAGALGLNNELLFRAAHFVGPDGEPGFCRVILKDDGTGGDESAGGDGPVLRVKLHGMGRTGCLAAVGRSLRALSVLGVLLFRRKCARSRCLRHAVVGKCGEQGAAEEGVRGLGHADSIRVPTGAGIHRWAEAHAWSRVRRAWVGFGYWA